MDERQDDLHSLLYDLAERTKEIAVSHSDEDEVESVEIPYLRREYLTYGDSIPGEPVAQTREEEITKEGISRQLQREVFNEIRETEIYEDAVDLIDEREINTRFGGPDSIVGSYVRSILENAENGVSEKDIAKRISILTSEIHNSPIYWNPEVWILGMEIEGDEIKLDENISVRAPKKEDLVDEIRIDEDARSGRRSVGSPALGPTAIIEFSERVPNREDVYTSELTILSVLQLFDVGSVSVMKVERNTESITRPFPIAGGYTRPDAPFSYTIDEDRSDSMSKFHDYMYKLVRENLIEPDEDNFLSISFDRYTNAVSEEDSSESQLTSAIMSLEAMLLKDEEKGELSERLSRRTDILLGMFNYQSVKIMKKIKKAYGIRSRYVHGSKTERDYSADLVHDIIDYARNCIVIFLLINEDLTKTELLNRIDRASVQTESRNALESDIEEITPELDGYFE